MRCRDVMKANVVCCSPEDTVFEAAAKMRDENIGFIPICDESRRVHGTLTDRDITIRLVAERKSFDTTCREVMTRSAVFCRPDDDLRRAAEKMATHHVSRMLCVDEHGALCGVLSLSDLAQRERSDNNIADTVRGVTQREVTYH